MSSQNHPDSIMQPQIAKLDARLQDHAHGLTEAILAGRYQDAAELHKAARKQFGAADLAPLNALVNGEILFGRELELTNHGIVRTFRFWSAQEKAKYLRFANETCAHLRDALGVGVCVGYGAVLAITRSNDLIPHDDDIDLIAAFPATDYPTVETALDAMTEALTGGGWRVTQRFASHLKIRRGGKMGLDIFAGLKEGDIFACFPGPRRSIRYDEVFPPGQVAINGVEVPVPCDREAYLAKVYGPDWRIPDPGFDHRWTRKPFLDILFNATAQ